jgi:hypothetical protein
MLMIPPGIYDQGRAAHFVQSPIIQGQRLQFHTSHTSSQQDAIFQSTHRRTTSREGGPLSSRDQIVSSMSCYWRSRLYRVAHSPETAQCRHRCGSSRQPVQQPYGIFVSRTLHCSDRISTSPAIGQCTSYLFSSGRYSKLEVYESSLRILAVRQDSH